MAQAPPVDTTVHSPQQAFGNVQRGHWEVQPEEIQLGSKIGEGANAVILKARFRGQTCVAKMLKSGVSANTQAYKDLIMELEILTSVTAHPNVVQFMGACIRTPEKPVVLEEYVDGPTLENFLSGRRGSRLEKRTIYGWSLDLLRALDFLHNRNPIIIHRDMKPANLLLVRDLSLLKLTDFGMSKKVDRGQRDSKQHKGYTGTVRYMAPEVITQRTGNYNERCDIYSASLIMWYIATVQRPPANDISKVHERPAFKVAPPCPAIFAAAGHFCSCCSLSRSRSPAQVVAAGRLAEEKGGHGGLCAATVAPSRLASRGGWLWLSIACAAASASRGVCHTPHVSAHVYLV